MNRSSSRSARGLSWPHEALSGTKFVELPYSLCWGPPPGSAGAQHPQNAINPSADLSCCYLVGRRHIPAGWVVPRSDKNGAAMSPVCIRSSAGLKVKPGSFRKAALESVTTAAGQTCPSDASASVSMGDRHLIAACGPILPATVVREDPLDTLQKRAGARPSHTGSLQATGSRERDRSRSSALRGARSKAVERS